MAGRKEDPPPYYRLHVFCCTNVRAPGHSRGCCSEKGSVALRDYMKARAKRLGYTIGQTGVHHHPRTAGEQSGANLGVILRAFKELFVLYADIRKTRPKPRIEPDERCAAASRNPLKKT